MIEILVLAALLLGGAFCGYRGWRFWLCVPVLAVVLFLPLFNNQGHSLVIEPLVGAILLPYKTFVPQAAINQTFVLAILLGFILANALVATLGFLAGRALRRLGARRAA